MSITSNQSLEKNEPFFGWGFLCDNVKTLGPKPDCEGIFTKFLSWGFPSARSSFIVFSLYNLPKEDIDISIQVRGILSQVNTGKKIIIRQSSNRKQSSGSTIGFVKFVQQFDSPGYYEIELSFENYSNKLVLPFEIVLEKWPKFSKKEIEFIRTNNLHARADVNCNDCDHLYIFEEAIYPEQKLVGGAKVFPEDGNFICDNCGKVINLKDLQGNIRSILKNSIKKIMKGGK